VRRYVRPIHSIGAVLEAEGIDFPLSTASDIDNIEFVFNTASANGSYRLAVPAAAFRVGRTVLFLICITGPCEVIGEVIFGYLVVMIYESFRLCYSVLVVGVRCQLMRVLS
jgi:hypothetical protein